MFASMTPLVAPITVNIAGQTLLRWGGRAGRCRRCAGVHAATQGTAEAGALGGHPRAQDAHHGGCVRPPRAGTGCSALYRASCIHTITQCLRQLGGGHKTSRSGAGRCLESLFLSVLLPLLLRPPLS